MSATARSMFVFIFMQCSGKFGQNERFEVGVIVDLPLQSVFSLIFFPIIGLQHELNKDSRVFIILVYLDEFNKENLQKIQRLDQEFNPYSYLSFQ